MCPLVACCLCSLPRFKQRFAFVMPEYGNLYALLDMAKVADCLVLLTEAERGVDAFGDYCLSCLFSQGLPATILAVQVGPPRHLAGDADIAATAVVLPV